MLLERPIRHLIPLMLMLTFTVSNMVSNGVCAEDQQQQDAERHGGKTLDEWIVQAKQGRRLEDREHALQIVRNFGLRHDRNKALRTFTELLSDKALTVRSLSAAGLHKAGKPTDPMAAAKLVEAISRDLSGLNFPRGTEEADGEFGLVLRVMGALEVIGETDHVAALRQVAENEKIDSIIRQAAEKAVRQIKKQSEASPQEMKQAEAIGKLEFLVGTWESVEQNNAPPAPETRTILLQPDGLSLTVTTESVLGKGRPVRIAFDLESQQYLLTHTNADGDTHVFNAELTEDGKLKIPIPESVLFSGLDFIVSINDGHWTETISQPSRPGETLYQRSFVRQHHDPLKAKP